MKPPSSAHPSVLTAVAISLALTLGLTIFMSQLAHRAQEQATQAVQHTLSIKSELHRLMASMVDAETGQRGYLLTGQQVFLQPQRSSLVLVPEAMSGLRRLTAQDAGQQARLNAIDALFTRKTLDSSATLHLAANGSREAAIAEVASGRGKALMDAIRVEVAAMEGEEARRLAQRQAAAARASVFSARVTGALVLLNLVSVGLALVLARRANRHAALITMCSWSRTIEYDGRWISFEEYLALRHDIRVSHGISPEQFEKLVGHAHSTSADNAAPWASSASQVSFSVLREG